jgi:hypothetical protein
MMGERRCKKKTTFLFHIKRKHFTKDFETYDLRDGQFNYDDVMQLQLLLSIKKVTMILNYFQVKM